MTEERNFKVYLVLINISVKSSTWLLATQWWLESDQSGVSQNYATGLVTLLVNKGS